MGKRAVFPQNRNCKWDQDCLEQTRGYNDDINDDPQDRKNDCVSNTWNKGGEIATATVVYDYTRCFKYLCLAWNTTSVPDEEGSSTHACYDHWDCVEGMVSSVLIQYTGFQVHLPDFLFQTCLKHEDDAIDKGFCIDELADLHDCVDNNDCSDGSVLHKLSFFLSKRIKIFSL